MNLHISWLFFLTLVDEIGPNSHNSTFKKCPGQINDFFYLGDECVYWILMREKSTINHNGCGVAWSLVQRPVDVGTAYWSDVHGVVWWNNLGLKKLSILVLSSLVYIRHWILNFMVFFFSFSGRKVYHTQK